MKREGNPDAAHPGEESSTFTPRPSPSLTAFVSHPDCARHDTGWKHPDHQGRLPGLVRAVYRDMLTLHGHLLDAEATPATEADLLLAHTPGYLAALREGVARAAAHGQPLALLDGGPMVSDASWDAALAATGTALTAADLVLRGEARNAFCMARPPGGGASADAPGERSLVNHLAVACRHLTRRRGVERVLVVEWMARAAPTPTARLLAGDAGVGVVRIALPAALESAPGVADALHSAVAAARPGFILHAAGFDGLAGDPLDDRGLAPPHFHAAAVALREAAEADCDGRLVSVLDGGYAPGLGLAVVQHLRALAGLPPA